MGRPAANIVGQQFGRLTAGQREFLKTGYTPEDWTAMFPGEEGEE